MKYFAFFLISFLVLNPLLVFGATDIVNDGTLSTGLVACWSMDEASGVRADSVASFDLTDNNTVGSQVGSYSNEALFVGANAEYFTLADSASFDFSSNLSWSAIVTFDALPADGNADWFFSKFTGTTQKSYRFRFINDTTDVWELRFSTDGSTENVDTINATTPTVGVPFLLTVVKNGTTATVYFNGTSQGTATVDSTIFNSTTNFALASGNGASYDGTFDGSFDEVAIWSSALDSSAVTSLYNSGSFLPCVDTSTPTATSTATSTDAELIATHSDLFFNAIIVMLLTFALTIYVWSILKH